MEREGITVVETAVGDRYVLEAMRAGGYVARRRAVRPRRACSTHATTGDGAAHRAAPARPGGRRPASRSPSSPAVMQRLPQVLVNVAGVDKARVAGSDRGRRGRRRRRGRARRRGPGAAAPERHRAARARHGRGADARSRPRASPSGSPRSCRAAAQRSARAPERRDGPYPGAMCGIVGYVGDQQALDVVVEGLRRLEYRGYDSAGVAVVDGRRARHRKRAGKLGQPGDAARRATRCRRRGIGIGHTRWATHGAPNDRNAHPHLDDDGAVAVIHNGIIENFAALRDRARGARPRAALGHRHRGRRAPARPRSTSAGGDLAEAMRAVCRRLEGAFTLVAVHADDARRRRRRAPQLPARRRAAATARTSSAATSPRSSRTPATRSSSARTRSSSCAATASTVTDFDGDPAEVTEYHVDWDASAAEKGGYDYFMLKEIAEQPRAVADTLLGRVDADGRLTPGRDAAVRRASCARSTRSSSSRAAPRTTPGCSPSTRSSTGPGCRARSSWPASSATATRSSPAARWSSRSPSPARRWTR